MSEAAAVQRHDTTARSLREQSAPGGHLHHAGAFYVAFGQLGKAERLWESFPENWRPGFMAGIADARGDQQTLQDYMRAWRVVGLPSAFNTYLSRQIRAGLTPDPAVLEAAPRFRQQLVAGELAFRRRDWGKAIASLEPALESGVGNNKRSWFYRASESRATAYLEVGDETQVLHVLERAAQDKPLYHGRDGIGTANDWLRVQARLAREYRRLGRIVEAVAIEDDVLHMLKYADADHPIVLQIREARAEAGSLTDA